MIKVLISGYYGFHNIGDEAVLAAIINGLKQVLPRAEIVVLSANPAETRKTYGVKAIQRLNLITIFHELKNAQLFISGGGSLLQDVTGKLTIPYYTSLMQLAKMRNVPIIFFSQGYGPVTGQLGRSLTKQALQKADIITVRDAASRQALLDLGLEEVTVTADPVFFLYPAEKARMKEIMISEHIPYNEKGPWIGVSIRPWTNQAHYLKEMATALDEIIDRHKANVLFIPFHHDQDREAIEKTRLQMKHFYETHVVEKQYRPEEILGMMDLLDVMVGMRLHSLIYAARCQVIPIGISYDPKVDSLLARLGYCAVGNTANLEASKVIEAVTDVLQADEAAHQKIVDNSKIMEQAAWQAICLARDLTLGARQHE